MNKIVGRWWNDKSIELVEIEGQVYSLNVWNGEVYLNCWKCDGIWASEERYTIKPIFNGKDLDYIVS